MSRTSEHPILVIGYGNTLRGDDAIGRRVAERIAASDSPGVEAISLTQLVPELAARIADARTVIFVDANAKIGTNKIVVQELVSHENSFLATHATGPRELLALTAACYDRLPPAWLVAVPATNFHWSESLPRAASESVQAAVRTVERLVERLRQSEAVHA